MDLQDALRKAGQILYQERTIPTVSYKAGSGEKNVFLDSLRAMSLDSERKQYPRTVLEDPSEYKFSSVNHALLQQLLSRLDHAERPSLLVQLARRVVDGAGCQRRGPRAHPSYKELGSETPLIAEFLVRNGGIDQLIWALGSKELELCPALAILLKELEDIISLNYILFSDAQYEILSAAIQNLAQTCVTKIKDPGIALKKLSVPGLVLPLRTLCEDIRRLSLGIREQCQRARYLYLKDVLLEGINQEINEDKRAVEGYLEKLQFSPSLKGALDRADDLYRHGSGFDLKSCLGHLRSFLEMTHLEAAPAICRKFGGDLPQTWGESIRCMQNTEILSKQESNFATSLFTLISDTGVHPLIAEREYARLGRNMVIEYVLLFFHKLDKLGLRNQPGAA